MVLKFSLQSAAFYVTYSRKPEGVHPTPPTSARVKAKALKNESLFCVQTYFGITTLFFLFYRSSVRYCGIIVDIRLEGPLVGG